MRYCVYIMSNRRRTVLYIGVTNNLPRRVWEHHRSDESHFCGRYRAYDVIHVEWFADISEAIRREKQLKGWTRARKLDLVRRTNPGLESRQPPLYSLPWE